MRIAIAVAGPARRRRDRPGRRGEDRRQGRAEGRARRREGQVPRGQVTGAAKEEEDGKTTYEVT